MYILFYTFFFLSMQWAFVTKFESTHCYFCVRKWFVISLFNFLLERRPTEFIRCKFNINQKQCSHTSWKPQSLSFLRPDVCLKLVFIVSVFFVSVFVYCILIYLFLLYPIGDCAKPQCDGSADDSLLPQVCLFVDCTNILGLFCLAESFRERAAVGQKLFGRNFSLKKRWLTRKCFEGNH